RRRRQRQAGPGDGGGDEQEPEGEDGGACDQPTPAGTLAAGGADDLGPRRGRGEQSLGSQQQRQEQHDERDAGREPAEGGPGGDELGGQGGGHADGQAPDVGERQTGEAADGGGPEGLHDQQRDEHG